MRGGGGSGPQKYEEIRRGRGVWTQKDEGGGPGPKKTKGGGVGGGGSRPKKTKKDEGGWGGGGSRNHQNRKDVFLVWPLRCIFGFCENGSLMLHGFSTPKYICTYS